MEDLFFIIFSNNRRLVSSIFNGTLRMFHVEWALMCSKIKLTKLNFAEKLQMSLKKSRWQTQRCEYFLDDNCGEVLKLVDKH